MIGYCYKTISYKCRFLLQLFDHGIQHWSTHRTKFGVEKLELDWFRYYHTGHTHTFTAPSGSSAPVRLTCSVPQGSVIDPKEFIMYTKDIKETTDRFIISYHLYGEDFQLLAHLKIKAVMEHRRRLETCVESLRDWCSSRRTRPN